MTTTPPPLWNKSVSRFLPKASGEPHATEADNQSAPAPAPWADEPTLAALGLKVPPQDPRLMVEFLRLDDAADGSADADEFARGIRRAVRIQTALRAKLHRGSGLAWKEWVEANFQVGYACLARYRVAAELQIGLIRRALPRLESEYQARVLAPHRHHEKFWDSLKELGTPLPPAKELEHRLPVALGVARSRAEATARIKFHRMLLKILATIPESDDAVIGQAKALVRQAVALLEKGASP